MSLLHTTSISLMLYYNIRDGNVPIFFVLEEVVMVLFAIREIIKMYNKVY